MKMMRGQRRADLAGPEHQLQPSTTQQRRASALPWPATTERKSSQSLIDQWRPPGHAPPVDLLGAKVS